MNEIFDINLFLDLTKMGYMGAFVGWSLAAIALFDFIAGKIAGHLEPTKDTARNISSWLVRHIFLAGPAFLFASSIIQYFDLHFILVEKLIPVNWFSFAMCFLLVDFIYYWHHRISHTFPFLWISHAVHHSSVEFNISTTLRVSWIAIFFNTFYYLPLIWIGFSPVMVALCRILVFSYQVWIHSPRIGALPYLDKIISTPNNHRFHHSNAVHHHNSNYAAVFILWDRLFGTFTLEDIPVHYGLKNYDPKANILKMHYEPIIQFYQRIKSIEGISNKIKSVFSWKIKKSESVKYSKSA